MKDTAAHLEILYKKVKDYTETSVSLHKLQAINTTADIISSLVSKALLILIISTFFLFLNIALSLYIGDVFESNYLGFILVSGFYLLIAIGIYLFKKSIIENPIIDLIIPKLQSMQVMDTHLKVVSDEQE